MKTDQKAVFCEEIEMYFTLNVDYIERRHF